MNSRAIDLDHDYETLCSWWRGHKWHPIPKSWLPKTGVIVEDGDDGVCAGFLYTTDSKLGVFEYSVTNPKLSPILRSNGLDYLISDISTISKKLEMEGLFSACGDEGLTKRMMRHGFNVIGTEVTNLMRIL
jgi:hypothetical protein